jgi:hypothetical protein
MIDLKELLEIMPNRVCLHDAELKLMQTKIDSLQAKIIEMTP